MSTCIRRQLLNLKRKREHKLTEHGARRHWLVQSQVRQPQPELRGCQLLSTPCACEHRRIDGGQSVLNVTREMTNLVHPQFNQLVLTGIFIILVHRSRAHTGFRTKTVQSCASLIRSIVSHRNIDHPLEVANSST